MQKKAFFGELFLKPAINHALNFPLRRLGWGKKYYEGASAAGIRAGITGQAHFPRLRRAIGQIAPDITGLSDYELSKGLTEQAAKAVKSRTKGAVSREDILHMFGGKTNLPPERMALLDSIKKRHPLTREAFGHIATNPQSVLGKNLKAGIEKVKSEGLEPKAGPLRNFARKYFKGEDKQVGAFIPSIAEVLHGSIPVGSIAENALTHAANKGINSPILYAKGHVMESGVGSVLKKQRTLGQKIKDRIVDASSILSPATGEFKELGKDLGRAELAKNKKMILERQSALLKAKTNGIDPKEALSKIKDIKNRYIPQPLIDEVQHAGRNISVNTRLGYRKASDYLGNIYNKSKTSIQTGVQSGIDTAQKHLVQPVRVGAKKVYRRLSGTTI